VHESATILTRFIDENRFMAPSAPVCISRPASPTIVHCRNRSGGERIFYGGP
jgi:hypothetical protein